MIKAAIKAAKSDTEIVAALTRLGTEGRSLTVETLRIELEGQPAPAPRVRASTADTAVAGAWSIAAELEAEQNRKELS